MTRKHYERLADALAAAIVKEGESEDGSALAAWRVADEVAEALRGTNPNYDLARFCAAVAARVEKALDTAPARA